MEELNEYDILAIAWKEMLAETQADTAFYYRLRGQHQDDQDIKNQINGILISLNTVMEQMHGEILSLKDKSRRLAELRRRGPDYIEPGDGPVNQGPVQAEFSGGQSNPLFGYDD